MLMKLYYYNKCVENKMPSLLCLLKAIKGY